jgi:glycosyltransferase involved in cell wall biosynthesis
MGEQVNRIKVMHVILNLNIGGAQAVVRTLVEHLRLKTCVPVVCTFEDGPIRREIELLGIPVEVLPPRRYSVIIFPLFALEMLRILISLSHLVRRYEIDIVQTHLLRVLDFLVLCLKWTTPLRGVFWTFHSANFMLTRDQLPSHRWLLVPKRYIYRLLYKFTSPWIDGFIAVSDQVKDHMLKIISPEIESKITVIPNGVDIRRYEKQKDRMWVQDQLGLAAQTRFIIQVGTLKPAKGHRYTIEAVASIVASYPDLHVLFVGDGEMRAELKEEAAALNLKGHTHFLGYRQDVPELLAASDIFVLPSLWEGLSMALLEAMASGLPIVSSAVSGSVQVLRHGETGVLVPPGDAAALAEAIRQLLTDPERAQLMGRAARQQAEALFSSDSTAQAYISLYREALVSQT